MLVEIETRQVSSGYWHIHLFRQGAKGLSRGRKPEGSTVREMTILTKWIANEWADEWLIQLLLSPAKFRKFHQLYRIWFSLTFYEFTFQINFPTGNPIIFKHLSFSHFQLVLYSKLDVLRAFMGSSDQPQGVYKSGDFTFVLDFDSNNYRKHRFSIRVLYNFQINYSCYHFSLQKVWLIY